MGKEIKGAVRIGKVRHQGKVLLETSEILFRGPELRLKILFSQIKSVKASGGELSVETKDGTKVFEVGTAAEKWREKILHPKSRAEKLGVKAGTRVRLVGTFEAEFLNELKSGKVDVLEAADKAAAEFTFLQVPDTRSLPAIAKCAGKIKGAESLWVVYPKGTKEITENDVLSAGRKSELKDVKVVGFSATHTALKFVLPVAKR
ncbi:MAG TPA: hypothetical protein VGF20_11265 [Candidatus Acidoferrum sp.]|jgi:hypothetical protein